MKKCISIMLSISILFSTIVIGFTGYASEIEKQAVSNFADECLEVITEHDADQDYEIVGEDVDEYDDLQFQTARLYVSCSSAFDKMGAEEVVGGFLDWHLLQFETPEQAKEAYTYYKSVDKIECVEPDVPIEVEVDASSEITYATKDEFENCYAKSVMGFDQVLPYIENNNIETSEVKIAVLDTGIDYNHEVFADRLFRTYFNSTDVGDADDEYDVNLSEGHGTCTTSCIVSCTPDTVKVGCYKAMHGEAGASVETKCSWIQTALLKAFEDGCSIISMSFGITGTQVLSSTLKYLYNRDVTLFVSAGNSGALTSYGVDYSALCTDESVVSVGASDNGNSPTTFSVCGREVDFLAPGANVITACPDNKYRYISGTSFSCPYAASVFATLLSLNQGFPREKLIDLMSITCQEMCLERYINNTWYGNAFYGSGVLDITEAFCEMYGINRISNVEFSINSGECRNSDNVELTCSDDSVEIYYTTDGTVPTKYNGTLYTKETIINPDGFFYVNAIAYKDGEFHSQNQYRFYKGFHLGTDEMFEIDENGVVTQYNGDLTFLEIPEKINGITITSIHPDLFATDCDHEGFEPSQTAIEALKLPDTVEYLDNDGEYGLLDGNTTIKYFSANNLKNLQNYMFYCCEALRHVNLPNVETIGHYTFHSCSKLKYVSLPNATSTGDSPFYLAGCMQIYLPKLVTFYENLFYDVPFFDVDLSSLEHETGREGNIQLFSTNYYPAQVFLPKLKELNTGLQCCRITRLEFSQIEALGTLPDEFDETNVHCDITAPLTLKEITIDLTRENLVDDLVKFTFYGSEGSYTQQWARENGLNFIVLGQNNAVYTDVRETCNEYTETLFFDSLGFNKQYQWYGSYDNSTDNGIALEGATDELITLHDYDSYPYYYCVCTSTDTDGETTNVVNIYSNVCENTDYQKINYTVDALGGSIRTTAAGLRFGFSFDNTQGAEVEEHGFVYSYSTLDDFDINTEGIKKKVATNLIDHGDYTTFNLVFTNIPTSAYNQTISARAYVKIGGEYFYSPILQRNFNGVAQAILADETVDQSTKDAINKLLNQEV